MSGPERVSPEMYARVFEGHHEGALILDDLVRRFGGRLWVKGGQDGQRETDYRLGRRAVLDHIVAMINAGNGHGPPPEDENQQDQPSAA